MSVPLNTGSYFLCIKSLMNKPSSFVREVWGGGQGVDKNKDEDKENGKNKDCNLKIVIGRKKNNTPPLCVLEYRKQYVGG